MEAKGLGRLACLHKQATLIRFASEIVGITFSEGRPACPLAWVSLQRSCPFREGSYKSRLEAKILFPPSYGLLISQFIQLIMDFFGYTGNRERQVVVGQVLRGGLAFRICYSWSSCLVQETGLGRPVCSCCWKCKPTAAVLQQPAGFRQKEARQVKASLSPPSWS